ncbi:MAG: hypothetical protein RHS_0799 [Robinsoniella sp. RHS]|nr:MAG: hypothetical protein RHS_0799 [Robinsoniella sp. RHS]
MPGKVQKIPGHICDEPELQEKMKGTGSQWKLEIQQCEYKAVRPA